MRDHQQVEPFSREMAELLAFERARPAPPEDMEKRVLWGVMTAVSLSQVPGGPEAAAQPTGPSGIGKLATGSDLSAAVAKAVVVFAVGAASGAGVHAWLAPEPQPDTATMMVPAMLQPAPPPVRMEVVPPPAVQAQQPKPLPAKERGARQDADLAAERAILEQARLALVRGRLDDAASALDDHARRFPEGRLTEEREALSILLASSLGHAEDARQRLDEFRQRHPNSMLLPGIEQRLHAKRLGQGGEGG